jgi:very-short-patch-repair endonuclease
VTTVLALIFIAVVIAAFVLIAKRAQGGLGEAEWPFYAKKPLSAPEQTLYFRLTEALPEHIVLAQVGLSRLLGVKKGNNFQAWNNRINRMSADFVVCAKDSTIVAVVELDDSSHEREDRKAADAKKNKALKAAGIRLVRWHVKRLPNGAAIRAELVAQQAATLPRN